MSLPPVVSRDEWLAARKDLLAEGVQPIEQPGYSCFLRDGDVVFHTYSTYARGTESVGGSHYFLDLTVLGRQQEFEKAFD
jgi:predicted dithiol-disulfide oxidoreductase (DUF899 family)